MTAFSDAILALSPEVYWKLDETSGTVAADSSGNGRDGTYWNGPVLGGDRLFRSAAASSVACDGVDDLVVFQGSGLPQMDDLTVVMVVNPLAGAEDNLGLVQLGGGGGQATLEVVRYWSGTEQRIQCVYPDNASFNSTNVAAEISGASLVVLRYGLAGADVTVNGVSSVPFTLSSQAGINADGVVGFPYGNGTYGKGDFSDFALFSSRLSDAQVADLWAKVDQFDVDAYIAANPSGSSEQLRRDQFAYWAAYDALTTEPERAALQRQFLLDHGGYIRSNPSTGERELVGGVWPVREVQP